MVQDAVDYEAPTSNSGRKTMGSRLVDGAVMSQSRLMLEGHRFGRLQIVRFVEVKNGHATFEAQCDCGAVVTVRSTDLIAGTKRKCGLRCAYRPPVTTFRVATIDRQGTQTRFAKLSDEEQADV